MIVVLLYIVNGIQLHMSQIMTWSLQEMCEGTYSSMSSLSGLDGLEEIYKGLCVGEGAGEKEETAMAGEGAGEKEGTLVGGAAGIWSCASEELDIIS